MTYRAKLTAYAKACRNESSFDCFRRRLGSRFDQIWDARIRLWWLSLNPLVASGRTRELACFHLWQIIRDYNPELTP